MPLKVDLRDVRIVHDIETENLVAYYGHALLWSTPVETLGSEGEATEFYTVTIIALQNAWSGMSNHKRMVLASACDPSTVDAAHPQDPVLGVYRAA